LKFMLTILASEKNGYSNSKLIGYYYSIYLPFALNKRDAIL